MITSDLQIMFIANDKLHPIHKHIMLNVADHYFFDFYKKNNFAWGDLEVRSLRYYGSGGELVFRDREAPDYYDEHLIDFRHPQITTNKWWVYPPE
jgi:hypothetical protein